MSARTTTRAPRRWFRRFLVPLGVSIAIGLGVVELGFRTLLFHDADWARRIGGRLRSPGYYAGRWSDEYWKLQTLFKDRELRMPEPRYDPVMGWRRPPPVLVGEAAEGVQRRPVLLFGDSFAACIGDAEDCWQGLLARSELGAELELHNHGTGGYGLDQIYLSFLEYIDDFDDRDPIVIIGILVDDDLDRSMLSFRGWPKPRLAVDEHGQLAPEGPVIEGVDAYLAANPVGIPSYAWRYLVFGTRALPDAWRERIQGVDEAVARTKALNSAILEALRDELDARDLEHFVLIFHGKSCLDDRKLKTGWRDRFLRAELERLGLAYVSSKERLRADAERTGRGAADYYITRGKGRNHYTALGNQVVFEAIRSGLLRQYDHAPD